MWTLLLLMSLCASALQQSQPPPSSDGSSGDQFGDGFGRCYNVLLCLNLLLKMLQMRCTCMHTKGRAMHP